MSLFGAMQSGISGLAAQSTAMGAISDNISNVNTVGYKNNQVVFSTLVTKQTSTHNYSPGGVQPVSKQTVNAQGLLAANSSSTALGISGNGYFVVNTSAFPGEGDRWAYTRAGDFDIDNNGYLKNSGGFYLQGWSLLPWDGNANATVVNVNGINYMKAYYDAQGNTVYINDNIVDNRNLRPINLSTIGGSAAPTHQLSYGANLPSGDPIFNASNPSGGGRHSVNALIYDSLGNASNLSLTYTKTSSNGWSLGSSVPEGAATVTLGGNYENFGDASADVYYAAGQLEFTSVPQNGSTITITDEQTGQDFTFEVLANPGDTPQAGNIGVDVSAGVVSASDFVNKLNEAIQQNMPGAKRFTADGNTIQIVQSVGGGALTVDASKCLACVQSQSNPVLETGIPTGKFVVQQIDNDIKNAANISFISKNVADYLGKTAVIDGKTFEFTNGGAAAAGNIAVDMAGSLNPDGSVNPVKLMDSFVAQIRNNVTEPERFVASGTSLEILPSGTGPDVTIDFTGLGANAVAGTARSNNTWVDVATSNGITVSNSFNVNNTDVESGSIVPAVRFNSDGTPKYFFADEMSIEWANGAENMNGDYNQGTKISLNQGNVGTNDGLTSLSGNFNTNYIKQDGAKFGSYAGVSIGEDGVVTALYDNGETRPIAILPLATFSNSNGLSALTGNSWIETDYSGQALLKQANTNGAGEIASQSLENSNVDLATEFANMIVTQRAYSAATKIITTANDMLDELTRMT